MQQRLSRRRFLKGTVAIGAGAVLAVYSDGSYRVAMAQSASVLRLDLIHTNDHHARIEPVLNGEAVVHGGVARRKTLIDNIRNNTPHPSLLVDAGDVFQGTLFFNQYSGMADLEFYEAMGYEAMAIGNHEFDKGPQALADFIAAANFPVMSANVVTTSASPLHGKILPHTIIEKGGKKIGLFSLTPTDTAELSSPGAGLTITDPLAAARAQVAALQAAGVFTIIALTHVGIDTDRQIARSVDGISVIIGGHSHTPMGPMSASGQPPYPELIAAPNGKPVVVAHDWEWGKWLGHMRLAFDASGTVIDIFGNPTEVAPAVVADQGFVNRITTLAAPIAALRARVIGSAAELLNGNRSDVRGKETNLGNLLADAMLTKSLGGGAVVAITNGGGIRASINAGNVTVGNVLEVLPFGNTLALTTVSGEQLLAALNNGVSQVETGAGRFPQVAGLTFSYNPALPAAARVTGVTVGGKPLDLTGSYRVVTNNFMLGGGDGYTSLAAGSNKVDSGFILADVLEEYVAANSPVTYTTDGRISTSTATAYSSSGSAPTPAALPNTAGPVAPLAWLLGLGAAAVLGGARLSRTAQEPVESVDETA
jgi:5'-nucleotidase / UDP-sugar diphosphatase